MLVVLPSHEQGKAEPSLKVWFHDYSFLLAEFAGQPIKRERRELNRSQKIFQRSGSDAVENHRPQSWIAIPPLAGS